MPLARLPAYSLVQRAKRQVMRGGIIAYATESCFGLGCHPKNAKALRLILRLKGRSSSKGMLVIGANMAQLKPYMMLLTQQELAYTKTYWPGHYTLLLPAPMLTLPWLRGFGHRSIGLRVTAHLETAALCCALGTALVSTSANRTKQRSLKTAQTCKKILGKKLLALPGKIGKHHAPSTIIDTISGKIVR